jgi:hypothetical protein
MNIEKQNANKKVFSVLSITAGSILITGDLLILLSLILPTFCQGVASSCGAALMFGSILTGGFVYSVAPFLSVLAIIFGIVGIIRKENYKAYWLAITGLGLGIIGEAIAVLFITFAF